jgi:hypothetical protein
MELSARKAPKFAVARFTQWKARIGLDQALTQAALDAAGAKS